MLYAVFVVFIEVENFEEQVEKLTYSMQDDRDHFESQLSKIKKESITVERFEDEVARQLNEKMQNGYFIIIKKISFLFLQCLCRVKDQKGKYYSRKVRRRSSKAVE